MANKLTGTGGDGPTKKKTEFMFGNMSAQSDSSKRKPLRLTKAQRAQLLDEIPAIYRSPKTVDASGNTAAERLLDALDAAIDEYTSRRKQSAANDSVRSDVNAIAAAAAALQAAIRTADPLARDLIDASALGAAIGRRSHGSLSQVSRYAISWQTAMEIDGLAAEASNIATAHPNYRGDNRSLLAHLWDVLSDAQRCAELGGGVLPVDKNRRIDRVNSSLFADDCIRNCTWAIGGRLPKSEWPVMLIRRTAELLCLAGEGDDADFRVIGRDVVFRAIDEWDPEKRAVRYSNQVDRTT